MKNHFACKKVRELSVKQMLENKEIDQVWWVACAPGSRNGSARHTLGTNEQVGTEVEKDNVFVFPKKTLG